MRITKKKTKENPPLLFNLAEIQNTCSKKFKISPDETLNIIQELYEKKLVILIDKPHPDKEGGVSQFLDKNKHLKIDGRFFQLSQRDIEQCYPDKKCPTYSNWKKSQEEVDQMKGRQKKQLAKHVGDTITKEQFESDLVICLNALQKCWELSF